MARFNPIQNAFTSGLLSDRLLGRDDLDQYHSGMRQTLNGIVLPHGGFQRRSGTYFVVETKDSSKISELIPFDVDVSQQYVLEFGDLYIRFCANEGQIESAPSTPLEVTTTYTEDEVRDLRYAQNVDVMTLVHENHHPYHLTRTAFDNFTWEKVAWRDGKAPMRPTNLDTSITLGVSHVSGPSGAGGIYDLIWSTDIGLNATDDVGRAVRQITSFFEIQSVTNGYTARCLCKYVNPTSPASPDNSDWALGLFSDTEGCRAVTYHEGRLWYGGARLLPDYVVASVSDDFNNFDRGNSTDENEEDADRSLAKRVVSTRLNAVQWMRSQGQQLAVGTNGAEFRIFGANNDILTPTATVIRPATARGSAFIEPVSVDSQVIYAHKSRRTMYEFKYNLQQDNYGSRNLSILANDVFDGGAIRKMVFQQQPDSVIWCAREDGKLVGLTYEPDQKVEGAHIHDVGGDVESLVVIDNSDHTADQLWMQVKRTINGTTKRYIEFMTDAFRPVLTRESTQQDRQRALDAAFFVDCGLSLDEPVAITAITQENPVRVTAPGHTFTAGTYVKFRQIGGMTELEDLEAVVTGVSGDDFHLTGVDGTVFTTYTSGGYVYEEVTSLAGLDHLEGETVTILADGTPHPTTTVSSGEITLTRRASIVHVGIGQQFKGETQRFVGGGRLGTDQGQIGNIKRVAIILHNTMGGSVGIGPDFEVEDLPYRYGEDELDQASPVFTGTLEVPVPGGWDNDMTVYFENLQPLPMTVLAIAPRAQSNER